MPDTDLSAQSTAQHKKISQQLTSLPKKPGCYLFRDSDGTVLYVGKAKVLRNRVRSYFHTNPNFTNPAKFSMLRQIDDIETIVVGSEMEALILESILVKKYEPRYNVLLKDDKHYLFIKVTVQEDFPRVETVRRVSKDGARYFGPFTNSFAVRDTLRLLQRIFPYRTCDLDLQISASPGSRGSATKSAEPGTIKARGYRPCLRFHMGRCDAPCIENISREDYRAVIDKVLLFLEGKLDFIVQDLHGEMERAAKQQLFERAARVRDQIRQIEHLTSKQVVLSPKFTNQDVIGFVTDRERQRAFASLMQIRDGKVLGQEHFVMGLDHSAGSADEEIIRRLIVEHYEQATFIPKQLIVPVKLSDQAALEQLLRVRATSLHLPHKPRIINPRTGLNKRLLSMAEENAQEFRTRKTHEWQSSDLNLSAALKGLSEALRLPGKLDRVEIYDISNIQGTSAVGSMVVFEQGKPNKQAYRRFKIATLKEEPNDVGMMKEVLRRRLRRLPGLVQPATDKDEPAAITWPKPDLIIVDGGKPQLGAALTVLDELDLAVPVVGLAKREEELIVPAPTVNGLTASGAKSIMLPRGSASLHLVQRMRDEAHRFAITFHRQVRGKRSRRSLLDEVVGIGPAKKRLLIQRYGSVSAIADASETELAKLIGANAAKALMQQLR